MRWNLARVPTGQAHLAHPASPTYPRLLCSVNCVARSFAFRNLPPKGAPVWTSTPRARRRSRKLFACARREHVDERTGRPCSASRPGCSPGIWHALAILCFVTAITAEVQVVDVAARQVGANFLEYLPIVMAHLDAERRSNAPSRAVLPVAHALRVETTLTDNQASKILGRHPRIVAAGYDTSVSSFTDQQSATTTQLTSCTGIQVPYRVQDLHGSRRRRLQTFPNGACKVTSSRYTRDSPHPCLLGLPFVSGPPDVRYRLRPALPYAACKGNTQEWILTTSSSTLPCAFNRVQGPGTYSPRRC